MKKIKPRFNVVDLLIILLIIAVVFAAVYFFILRDSGEDVPQNEYRTIEYVIEMKNVDERLQDAAKNGQLAQDAILRNNIGTVVGVQTAPYEKVTFNSIDGSEIVSAVEGKIFIMVTIEAQAVVTDKAYTVNGSVIRVGQEYSIMLPDLYLTGYCVAINEK